MDRRTDLLGKELHEEAVRHRDLDRAEKLIADGAQIEAQDDKYGGTPLMNGVSVGDVKMVELLVSEGTDMTSQWQRVRTAPRSGDDVEKTFLTAGAEAGLGVKGYSALTMAVMWGKTPVLDVLIRHSVNINGAD
eukprot:g5789.t1